MCFGVCGKPMIEKLLRSLSAQHRSRRGGWVARSFWAVMLVGHLPALIVAQNRLFEATPDPLEIVRFILLLLSVVYFTLKLLGFRFWKLDPSWDRIVIYCLVVLLLHSGVIIDTKIPLGQSGLGWVNLVSPFLVVLTGTALTIVIHQHTQLKGILIPIPVARQNLSRDILNPPSLREWRDLFISSLSRRGPPTSLFR